MRSTCSTLFSNVFRIDNPKVKRQRDVISEKSYEKKKIMMEEMMHYRMR
jgi:hypothetical protein